MHLRATACLHCHCIVVTLRLCFSRSTRVNNFCPFAVIGGGGGGWDLNSSHARTRGSGVMLPQEKFGSFNINLYLKPFLETTSDSI